MPISLEIKNQLKTDFCLGCAISSAAEAIVGEPCDEAYSYAAGRKVSGKNIESWGLKPRHALRGALEYGVLQKKYSPYSLETHDRDFLADFNNWRGLERFTVKPFHSFRKIRNFASMEYELQKSPLIVGLYWQGEWDDAPQIPYSDSFHFLEPHEVLAIGMRNGSLVLQNSRGPHIGDNGLWYLPKNMWKTISHIYALSSKPWRSPIEKLFEYLL